MIGIALGKNGKVGARLRAIQRLQAGSYVFWSQACVRSYSAILARMAASASL